MKIDTLTKKITQNRKRFDVDCLLECYLLFNQQKRNNQLKITPFKNVEKEGKKQQKSVRFGELRLERTNHTCIGLGLVGYL